MLSSISVLHGPIPFTKGMAALMSLNIALFANWTPAWRATRVDLVIALKCE